MPDPETTEARRVKRLRAGKVEPTQEQQADPTYADAEGVPNGLAGSAALVQHIRHLEEELSRLEQGLEQSRRLATLGSLAAAVSHELNNVLTPMTSYAQLAMNAPEDRALTRKALASVVDGVERATRITRSVLGLMCDDVAASNSLVEDNPELRCCGLREVVASSLDCLVGQPGRSGVRVEVDVPAVRVMMPQPDLQQVVVNLLLNAHKAVTAGRSVRRVMVEAEQVVGNITRGEGQASAGNRSASMIELRVTDTGPGIPEHVRDRLFEPFVTCPVAAATAEPGGAIVPTQRGTGLGLSVCRDLVERAGGSIHADPSSSGGAVFRVRLPIADPVRAATGALPSH